MNCPKCSRKTAVKRTLPYTDIKGPYVIRERTCQNPDCAHRFCTDERPTKVSPCPTPSPSNS